MGQQYLNFEELWQAKNENYPVWRCHLNKKIQTIIIAKVQRFLQLVSVENK